MNYAQVPHVVPKHVPNSPAESRDIRSAAEVLVSGVVFGVGGHPPAFKDYLLRARSLEFKAASWKLPMIFCILLLFASEWMIWMFIVCSFY
jgi:hypothetical protein